MHNIICQDENTERTFEYKEGEEKVLMAIMSRINRHVSRSAAKSNLKSDRKIVKSIINAQMFLLGQGLKKFGEKGKSAAKAELSQMHHRTCFRAITVAELSRREKLRAMEGLMFFSQKNRRNKRPTCLQRQADSGVGQQGGKSFSDCVD